ncbi:MAG: FecR domain-containing protein [Hyphomicrobiales bacterium]|nr:FecR domain-containing protein [Hyphomicrobiales bacterium]MCP5372669.1 FecR domain-containing protein [Hyphomicrobiales bacterium]
MPHPAPFRRPAAVLALAAGLAVTQVPWSSPAAASDGTVKSVSGTAHILRGAERIPAQAGMPVQASDLIETGADGKLGITFKDNTRMSFGPNSRFALEEYAFDPKEQNLSLTGKIAYGTMSFVSGQIGKLAPDKVKLDTPMGSIGLRGTKILVKVPKGS